MNKKQYKIYCDKVEKETKGLSVSTGACPGCNECNLDKNATEKEIDIANEPSFSWSCCDICNTRLGGDRYYAHGINKDNKIIHFDICSDCLMYLNYGQLDDMTMLDTEKED